MIISQPDEDLQYAGKGDITSSNNRRGDLISYTYDGTGSFAEKLADTLKSMDYEGVNVTGYVDYHKDTKVTSSNMFGSTSKITDQGRTKTFGGK